MDLKLSAALLRSADSFASSDIRSCLMSRNSMPISAKIASVVRSLCVLCISRNVITAAAAPRTVTATPGSGDRNQNHIQHPKIPQIITHDRAGLDQTTLAKDSTHRRELETRAAWGLSQIGMRRIGMPYTLAEHFAPTQQSRKIQKIQAPEGSDKVSTAAGLGTGEREAAALGMQVPGAVVILDERLGRLHAAALKDNLHGHAGNSIARESGRPDSQDRALGRTSRPFRISLIGENTHGSPQAGWRMSFAPLIG
jgi:hypothetical protein